MRVFRAGGILSQNFSIPLTRGGAQQAVVILDARDPDKRPGDADMPDSLTLYLVDGSLLAPDDPNDWANTALVWGREVGTVHAHEGALVRTAVLTFDPEPGEVFVAQLSSGYTDERSSWEFRVLLDGVGTLPLVVSPANPSEVIEGETEDGSFISDIQHDIYHVDAELEPETRGVQTVGVTGQFDAETGYMILGSGQLLDKNMTTGETHLLARITSYVEFPVSVNYFPDANIEADFRRDIAGLALDITDMMLTKDGAVFGFEGYMPAELGGFLLERGAFSAPDGDMLITRTGIAGAAEFGVADKANSRLFHRFNADLSEIEIAYDEAADTLTLAPVVTLPDFIAPGQDLPLHFSEGAGFVVEAGAGRIEGGLSAFGSYRIVNTEGADPFRVTLEALALDLSDPTVINLRTGIAVDIGFGRNMHLPAVEARVGVTSDFTLDELVLELPELGDLPLAPPIFWLTGAKLGLYGLAPGGISAKAAFEADISILPDMPLPGSLEEVADLGQITIKGSLGFDGFEGGGKLTLGTLLGGSLFELDTTIKIDAATRTLTAKGAPGLGLPILGTGVVNSFELSAGLDGSAKVTSSLTLSIPSNIVWLLSLADLPAPGSATFTMTGNLGPWGTYADHYLEGTVDLGVLGFEVELGAKLGLNGILEFSGYDLSDAPDFVESPPSGPADTERQGVEAREGQDLAMRTVGETSHVALIGPDGTRRNLTALEADETDSITIHRDAGGVSVFIADAAAGRWALEAATGNGFLAMEEQQALEVTTRLLGSGAARSLYVTAGARDGSEAGQIRLEVYRDDDASGFDGALAALTLVEGGYAEFSLAQLGLPEGSWNLHVRAVADGFVEARQYHAAPVTIGRAEVPDAGIVSMRWIPIEGLGDGETPRYGLEVTLREYGRITELGRAAQLVINGQVIEDFALGFAHARQSRTSILFAEPGESFAAPPPGQELRAILTLLTEGHETNLANNTASAALYTSRDGVTSPLLLGTPDADVLRGTTGAERLQGLAGDDRLIGGGGGDTLQGGKGNDRYWLASNDDKVAERADEGVDHIYSSASATLGAHVENLILQGTGNTDGFGNDLANRITGNSGRNHLHGMGGDDRLNGGLGADSMEGGNGNDTYHVDNAGDAITELADGGSDRVIASVSYTLSATLERLSLTGTGNLNGTGNALANRLDGNSGNNILDGGEGHDAFYGLTGNDTLTGGGGNDTLDGGLGADSMEGGTGNDTYYVDNAGDAITELADGGSDRVTASVSYALSAQLERLSLTGAGNLDGTGNALANRLDGNSGNNILDGGEGHDALFGLTGNDALIGGGGNDTLDGGVGADSMGGGLGADRFVFRSVVEANGDTITDFSEAQSDRIDLRPIDANANLAGDQAFAWIGGAGFSGAAGELRLDGSLLQGDVNGDFTADFQITLSGAPSLTTANIWL